MLTQEQLEQMINDENPDVRAEAARYPNLSPRQLERLAWDKEEKVREIAAQHPLAISRDRSYFYR